MTFKLTHSILKEIVDSSVKDAMQLTKLDDEAWREKVRQARLEDTIAQTVGHAEKETKGAAKEEDPQTAGGPTRDLDVDAGAQKAPPEGSPTPAAGEIDAAAIIDKFNIIRSGRSMNDKDISQGLQKFLGTLRPEQRQAMFSILQNVSKIVAPTVDSNRLQKPAEEPSAIQAARVQMLQKRREDGESAAATREKNQSAALAPEEPQAAPKRAAPMPQATPPEEDEIEDTSPPIRVGKRTAESLRVKMKQLLQD